MHKNELSVWFNSKLLVLRSPASLTFSYAYANYSNSLRCDVPSNVTHMDEQVLCKLGIQ